MAARSYAILGCGGIGGYYGSRLWRAGLDVHFLLHSDYEHVTRHGLAVESIDGDVVIPPDRGHFYRDVGSMPACDVVAICLKTTRNDLLPALLPPVMKPDGVALVLQNGLGNEDLVARVVGPGRVMGGLCFICSTKVGPGRVRHVDYGMVTFAEHAAAGSASPGITDRLRRVAGDFERAGVPVRLASDLRAARWKKLVWNVPFNGLSVVLDATTDRLLGDPDAAELVRALMEEVVADAQACGSAVGGDVIDKMLDQTAKMAPYLTSMKTDYDLGRPMEVEAIFGNPLRAASAAGLASPRLETLYRELRFLDGRSRAGRGV